MTAIQEALEALLTAHPKIAQLTPPWTYRPPAGWQKTVEGAAFLCEFEKDAEMNSISGQMLYIGTTGMRHESAELAGWIVARATAVGSENALSEFRSFASATTVSSYHFALLSDLHAEEEIEFHDGTKLIAASDLPNRLLARQLDQLAWSGLPFPRVRTALLREHKLQKSVGERTEQITSDDPHECFTDIALCVALARPPDYGAHILAFSETLPDHIPLADASGGWRLPATKRQISQPSVIAIQLKHAVDYYKRFSALDESLRARLRIPMGKLNDYGGQSTPPDSLIDLRVAMESFFMGDGNKDQLRYRLSLRAALYLESDPAKRQQVFKAFGEVYDETSHAVHNGRVRGKADFKTIRNVATSMQVAVRRAITEGKIPDWVTLELGA